MQSIHLPPVCMRPQATYALIADHGICNGWVVQQAKLVIMACMQRADGICLGVGEAQGLDEGIKDELGRLVELPEEAGGEVAEARQRVLGEPDVVLYAVLLAANLVALLVVGRGRVLLLQVPVVGLAGRLDSTALFAGPRVASVRRVAVGMRGLHLIGVGQAEKLIGHGEGLMEQLGTDAVPGEPDAAVDKHRLVQLLGPLLADTGIGRGAGKRREVDDGDHVWSSGHVYKKVE